MPPQLHSAAFHMKMTLSPLQEVGHWQKRSQLLNLSKNVVANRQTSESSGQSISHLLVVDLWKGCVTGGSWAPRRSRLSESTWERSARLVKIVVPARFTELLQMFSEIYIFLFFFSFKFEIWSHVAKDDLKFLILEGCWHSSVGRMHEALGSIPNAGKPGSVACSSDTGTQDSFGKFPLSLLRKQGL